MSYSSSRWLWSCPPLAITRIGRAPTARFMRSKKWQHFSTSVPPVFVLNRFQFPTFTRKGNRCSRMASIRRSPITPPRISARKRDTGGM